MALKVIQCFRNASGGTYVGGVSTMINAYFESSDLFVDNGCEIELFDYHPKKESKKSKIANISYIFKQRRALSERLKKDNKCILHIHTSREFLFLKDVYLAKMANKKYGIPVVITVHVGDIDTVFNRIQRFKSKCIKHINRYISKIVCLTNKIRDQFIAAGVEADKCIVLGNFHHMAALPDNVKLVKETELQLLFVGAIHREKGIIELLTAMTKIGHLNCKLDVCGQLTDSSIEACFNELVSALGDKVILHGYVNGEEKSALFERADALILPSYHEGFPLVILEALNFGCAIVSTEVGATPEILVEGENALWIRAKNSEDITVAISRFYEDKNLLAGLKENNAELGKEFSLPKHIIRLCEIYNHLGKDVAKEYR